MSDDEFYPDSPYDDIEDILYDADPAPNLADDLAEHTVHSPAYQDDIRYDLLEYYSDWEYYSDDYYDDDPALLKNNPQDGYPVKQSSATLTNSGPEKRGRKRKLVETVDIPALEQTALTNCIQGTVWAQPTRSSPEAYRQGQDEPVALLKNWKDVFSKKSGQGAHKHRTFGKAQMQDDESWAKDMSLADMGLMNARGAAREGSAGDQADAPDEESEENEEGVGSAEDEVSEKEGHAYPNDAMAVLGNTLEKPSTMETDKANPAEGGSFHRDKSPIQEEDDPGPRKRRKIGGLHSPPTSSGSSVVPGTKPRVPSRKSKAEVKPTTIRPTHSTDATKKTTPAIATNSTEITQGKKRKAPEEVEEKGGGLLKSTASSRAKRVASSKVVKEVQAEKATTPAATTRTTRSRGKQD